jgi:hypothetical protein
VLSRVIKSASPLSAALCTPRASHEGSIQTVNQIADPQRPALFQPVPGTQKSGFRRLAQTAAGQLKIESSLPRAVRLCFYLICVVLVSRVSTGQPSSCRTWRNRPSCSPPACRGDWTTERWLKHSCRVRQPLNCFAASWYLGASNKSVGMVQKHRS